VVAAGTARAAVTEAGAAAVTAAALAALPLLLTAKALMLLKQRKRYPVTLCALLALLRPTRMTPMTGSRAIAAASYQAAVSLLVTVVAMRGVVT
jgi:hypothetical protein